MEKGTIEKGLAAFSFGRIQDFITLHRVMRRHKISISDLEDYAREEQTVRVKKTEEIRQRWEKMPDCPECGGKLAIRAINLPKGPLNRQGWKSLWHCPAGDCVYEVYSRRTVVDEIERTKSKSKKCR